MSAKPSMSVITPSYPKDHIILLGFYDGTSVDIQCSRDQYPATCDTIKKAGRHQLKGLLEEFITKEKAGDFLIKQMDTLHKQILAVATEVTDENLQLAWGDDWKMKKSLWLANISTLLYIKRIQNNDQYGWMKMEGK